MPTFLAHAGTVVLVWILSLSLVPVMVWFERKGSAYMQDRTGPNRAAVLGIRMGGLIHTIADVLKLIFKEDVTPPQVNRFYYTLAPFLSMMIALLTFIVIPIADDLEVGGHLLHWQGLKIDAGLIWIFAVTTIGTLAMILAGWGSNNRYALLGGMRSSAQMISYELALGLSVIGVLLVYGTLDLNEMVRQQGELVGGFLPKWGVVVQPLAALLFMTAAVAETNRTPFDLPEGESEIIGYHVEYSSLKFALFFMAEYVNVVVSAALTVTLFFGGWQIPWLPTPVLEANATSVLLVTCAGVLLLSLALAMASVRWSHRLKQLYTDARRREGDFWTVVLLLQAALAVLVAIVVLANPLEGLSSQIFARVAQFGAFLGKVTFFAFLFIWIRWTLPRFRYDQLMNLGWKSLLPLALLNIAVTAVVLRWLGR
ncbi:MAG: NADH-quinone oxidoreductase subunit H [Candidatus Eisenbacteria bacterium]|nr:NADH-quinone oxidoreductase subunit H [Candidatus Latescibacterota bacterium]MBD3303036.1 NADH-quinone oxidoreductase subunit H [Candidatus Eisenbacteria bacterium]